MLGMRLAPHFLALILALIATVLSIVLANVWVLYAAAGLQIITTITAFTQVWPTLKYNFQTAPSYAPHLTLMMMLPVLALASIL